MNKHFARRLALAVAACFTWSLALASSARAITARPPAPPSRTRPLSTNEMQHIVGAQSGGGSAPVAPAPFPPAPVLGGGKTGSPASGITTNTIAPIGGDPTGGGSGGRYVNVGTAPGPSYAWEGTVGDVKTDTGNKMTEIPLVGWTARGGLPVGVSLIHNSLGDPNRYLQDGPKWTTNYDSWVSTTDSGNSVTVSWADGRAYTFFRNVDGSYASPTGVYDTLSVPYAGGMDIVTKDQVRYRFNAWGTGASVTYFLVSVSDENGNTISISRNGGGARIDQIVDPTGRTIILNKDSSNRLAYVVDPMGRQWGLGYDGAGNLVSVWPPKLGGAQTGLGFGYDGSHNITTSGDLKGNQSHAAYNADSTIAWEQTPLGNRTTFSYGVDQNGASNALATTITAPNGVKTAHVYDSQGRLTAVTDALGYAQRPSNYDGNNNAQTVQDKRGFFWNYTFDGMGNVLTAKSPTGDVTTLQYNGHNKPTWIKAPGGEQVALSYDGSDNLTQVQNKDAGGSVKATTRFTVSASTYGLVSDKYDANNHHTHYDYDGSGNLQTVTTPLGRQTGWTYNSDGVATSRVDALGITTTYTLDEWNRTTAVSYSNVLYPGSDGNKSYSYDYNSNLTGFSNNVGSYTRSYDADNRMLEEDRGSARQVSHTYDGSYEQGLLSSTTDADGNVVNYGYTQRDELAWVAEYSHTTNYTYDPDGHELTINDPWGNFATKTWDNNARLSTLVNKDPYGSYLSGYGYGYNSDSQKTSCAEYGSNGGSYANVTWQYDALGHLRSEGRSGGSTRTTSYVVDGVGNRTSQTINGATTTYSYDNDDELTGDSTGSIYQYDASGNMDARRRGGSWIYPCSTNENQIAQIYTGGQLPTYSYGYDALGRQVFRVDQNNTRTDYQYDGGNVLTEQQNGSTSSRYLLGTHRLAKYGEAPQLDGLGSMRQGIDMNNGVFTGQTDYSAFGEVIGGNNTGAFQSVYQWGAQSGYRMDGGSGGGGDCGLVKVGARYYDPAIGRFTSRDSDLSQSAYVYCYGDPINFVDFTGHEGVSPDAKYGIGHSYIIGGIALGAVVLITVVTIPITLPIIVVTSGLAFVAGGMVGYGVRLKNQAETPSRKHPNEGKDPREPVAAKGGVPGSAGFGITTSFSADPSQILKPILNPRNY